MIVQIFTTSGPAALNTTIAYQDVVEYMFLDTRSTDNPGLGASGEAHSWQISFEVARRDYLPEIPAGCLLLENAAEAIRSSDHGG